VTAWYMLIALCSGTHPDICSVEVIRQFQYPTQTSCDAARPATEAAYRRAALTPGIPHPLSTEIPNGLPAASWCSRLHTPSP
jgi:hypothetical protein